MRFLDPLLLTGLAAAALPLLIHLINRRRARRHRFAAMELVLRSNKRTARRFRLKQLLLLVVRTLAIAAVPFAMARPFAVTETGTAVVPAGTPTSVVLVVDDSMSMRWSDGGDSLLRRAVEEAQAVVAGLSEQDNAALVLAGAPPRALVAELTYDRRALQEALAAIRPTWRRTDLAGAVTQAAGLLEASPLAAQRILLLSDLQAAGFEPTRLPEPGSPEVVVVDLAPEGGGTNRAITDVKAERAAESGPDVWRFDVTVRASGADAGGEVPLSLMLNGASAARGFVGVEAGKPAHKVFRATLPEGGVDNGRVVLEGDGLPADDERAFSVRVRPRLRVLVVNGDPRSVRYEDEVFYLEKALLPSAGGRSGLRPRIVLPAALAEVDLAAWDVVILANVGEAPEGVAARLVDWVGRGGGLLLTAGDQMAPDRVGWLDPLLPARIREIRVLTPESGREPARLAPVSGSTSLVDVFAGPGGEGLRAATFSRHLLLEPNLEPDRRTLLELSDGAPALVERRLGRGRVLLLTTSADLDWSGLAASTGFLPLLQELCFHAAGAPTRKRPPVVEVGGAALLPVPEGAQGARVEAPDGRVRTLGAPEVAGRAEVALPDTSEPGLYHVEFSGRDGQLLGERDIVLAPPSEESDLTPLPAEVRTALAGGAADLRDQAQASPERRSNLWPWALLLLILLLLSEASLLVRRRRALPPLQL